MVVKNLKTFKVNNLRLILQNAHSFITNLEKFCEFPPDRDDSKSTDGVKITAKRKQLQSKNKKTGINVKERLRGLQEIKEKLREIKGKKMNNIQETLYKKNLKTRLTKQQKKEKRKQLKAGKNKTIVKGGVKNEKSVPEKEPIESTDAVEEGSTEKVVFNKADSMVFNRIDFSDISNAKSGKIKVKKQKKDPKVLLEDLKKSKSQVIELKESGESEKARKLIEKQMWSSALKRSEGIKVKDDEILLKRTMRKQKEMKNRRKKKWDARIQNVDKQIEDRQKKRKENISAKKKERKNQKIKRAVKKGRVVLN